ncbi:MAG: 3-oxoacyl-[acyl-carrier-protein] reductase FabG [Chlamydiae bacterium]|nr:3-oxoacyl-[acyl-carrier-protein] reductase FabG [Chlamydiota bacterium]
MEKILAEKTAVVTGGTRGIGKAIAKRFVEQGASVVILGTHPERGESALNELKELTQDGQKVAFYPLNISVRTQVEETFTRIYDDFGAVDILVNNAGVTRDGLFMRMSEENWDHVLNTNLNSVYFTCQAVIRPMLKARSGRIINITSVVGLMGNPGQTNYAASKAGMIGFTKSLAKESASRGITVNCVAPGFVKTDMTDSLNEKQQEAILSQVPMQRMAFPEEIADAVLFFASPMATYITGQTLIVDGGLLM